MGLFGLLGGDDNDEDEERRRAEEAARRAAEEAEREAEETRRREDAERQREALAQAQRDRASDMQEQAQGFASSARGPEMQQPRGSGYELDTRTGREVQVLDEPITVSGGGMQESVQALRSAPDDDAERRAAELQAWRDAEGETQRREEEEAQGAPTAPQFADTSHLSTYPRERGGRQPTGAASNMAPDEYMARDRTRTAGTAGTSEEELPGLRERQRRGERLIPEGQSAPQARQAQRMPGGVEHEPTDAFPPGADAPTTAESLEAFRTHGMSSEDALAEATAAAGDVRGGLRDLAGSFSDPVEAVEQVTNPTPDTPAASVPTEQRQEMLLEAQAAMREYHGDDGEDEVLSARRRARALKAVGVLVRLGMGAGAMVAGARGLDPHVVGGIAGAGRLIGGAMMGNQIEEAAIGDAGRRQQRNAQQDRHAMNMSSLQRDRARTQQSTQRLALDERRLQGQEARDAGTASRDAYRAETSRRSARSQSQYRDQLGRTAAGQERRLAEMTDPSSARSAEARRNAAMLGITHSENATAEALEPRILARERQRRRGGSGTGGGGGTRTPPLHYQPNRPEAERSAAWDALGGLGRQAFLRASGSAQAAQPRQDEAAVRTLGQALNATDAWKNVLDATTRTIRSASDRDISIALAFSGSAAARLALSDEQQQLIAVIQRVRSIDMKEISGAAVSEHEMVRLSESIAATRTSSPSAFRGAMDRAQESLQRIRAEIQANFPRRVREQRARNQAEVGSAPLDDTSAAPDPMVTITVTSPRGVTREVERRESEADAYRAWVNGREGWNAQ